jgi:hypothetical protein
MSGGVTPITATREESFIRRTSSFIKAGKAILRAWGRIMWRKVCVFVNA